MSSFTDFITRLFVGQSKINNQKSTIGLTTGLVETDSTFYPGSNMASLYCDWYTYDRKTVLARCLQAWRTNACLRQCRRHRWDAWQYRADALGKYYGFYNQYGPTYGAPNICLAVWNGSLP